MIFCPFFNFIKLTMENIITTQTSQVFASPFHNFIIQQKQANFNNFCYLGGGKRRNE